MADTDSSMPTRSRGLVLFSGGLDSILAALVLREQGCYVEGLIFTSPFFGASQAKKSADLIDLKLNFVDFSDDILSLVEHPKHGFGGALNPCIDCHGRMIMRAGEICREWGWDFVATGEVLNQRPMSQNRRSLEMVAKDCNMADILIRPLSAQLLPETEVERKGLVDRSKLQAIEGRSRKSQMALAEHFGLKEYPSSAGGCLLTEKLFANKLGLLRDRGQLYDRTAIELLKLGRHFLLPGGAKAIVGRNVSENERLRNLAANGCQYIIRPIGVPGPTTLLDANASEEDIEWARKLCAAYSDKTAGEVKIRRFLKDELLDEIPTVPMEREDARPWLL